MLQQKYKKNTCHSCNNSSYTCKRNQNMLRHIKPYILTSYKYEEQQFKYEGKLFDYLLLSLLLKLQDKRTALSKPSIYLQVFCVRIYIILEFHFTVLHYFYLCHW